MSRRIEDKRVGRRNVFHEARVENRGSPPRSSGEKNRTIRIKIILPAQKIDIRKLHLIKASHEQFLKKREAERVRGSTAADVYSPSSALRALSSGILKSERIFRDGK